MKAPANLLKTRNLNMLPLQPSLTGPVQNNLADLLGPRDPDS